MKRLLLGLAPLMMFASTITFNEALKETFANNKELKAKKLNIELAKEDLKKAKSKKCICGQEAINYFYFGKSYYEAMMKRNYIYSVFFIGIFLFF